MSFKTAVTDYAGNKQKINCFPQLYDERDRQIEKLKKEVTQLHNKITLKDSNLLFMKFENEKLTENIIHKSTENQSLKTQISILQDSINSKDIINEKLIRDIEISKVVLSEKEADYKAIKTKADSLEVNLVFKDNDNNILKKQMKELSDNYNQILLLNKGYEERVKQCQSLTGRVVELVKQLQKKQKMVKQLKKELNIYKQKYDEQYFQVLNDEN